MILVQVQMENYTTGTGGETRIVYNKVENQLQWLWYDRKANKVMDFTHPILFHATDEKELCRK